MQSKSTATVKLGDRVYESLTWKRKDRIYLGDKLIGTIQLSEHDRQGKTIALPSGEVTNGRAIAWCVEKFEESPQSSSTGSSGRGFSQHLTEEGRFRPLPVAIGCNLVAA